MKYVSSCDRVDYIHAYFVCPIVTLHADRAEVRPCWWLGAADHLTGPHAGDWIEDIDRLER
jgi:hypothetical protein